MPSLCRYSTAQIVSAMYRRASTSSRNPRLHSSEYISPPGTYSIARYSRFCDWKLQKNRTISGFETSAKISRSVITRPTSCFSTMSSFCSTLIANKSPDDCFLARYTLPNAPREIGLSTLKSEIPGSCDRFRIDPPPLLTPAVVALRGVDVALCTAAAADVANTRATTGSPPWSTENIDHACSIAAVLSRSFHAFSSSAPLLLLLLLCSHLEHIAHSHSISSNAAFICLSSDIVSFAACAATSSPTSLRATLSLSSNFTLAFSNSFPLSNPPGSTTLFSTSQYVSWLDLDPSLAFTFSNSGALIAASNPPAT
mmetsp:Transcript_10931/g.23356  ORF Transcript_10931/g.23356 Transcript_10931/m.23356 type:complete len:312 (-) Transcript_10931:458-1393(-)